MSVVHDDVRRFLEKVPQGERRRTIDPALREWARRRRRRDAAAGMDRLRDDPAAQPVTTAGTVRWIREDRAYVRTSGPGHSSPRSSGSA